MIYYFNKISGGVAERSKAAVLKTVVPSGYRGFESYLLRHFLAKPKNGEISPFAFGERRIRQRDLARLGVLPGKTTGEADPPER